jgi:hypothetical protein
LRFLGFEIVLGWIFRVFRFLGFEIVLEWINIEYAARMLALNLIL